jgi:NAD(P)-dependent dehydrogenase (short-subunit alcohol dehydrogenase family)
MKVVVADIDEPGMEETRRLITARGDEASVHPTDVRVESAVQALARHTIDTYGAVHLVCNNAGVEWGNVFLEAPIEGWKWVMDVNFWGALHGCRVFLPLLAQQEEAHLINVASTSGLTAPLPTFAPIRCRSTPCWRSANICPRS